MTGPGMTGARVVAMLMIVAGFGLVWELRSVLAIVLALLLVFFGAVCLHGLAVGPRSRSAR